jgi:hypothetical protein
MIGMVKDYELLSGRHEALKFSTMPRLNMVKNASYIYKFQYMRWCIFNFINGS